MEKKEFKQLCKQLRNFSLRIGKIELRPISQSNDTFFEIVKWYPNEYYGLDEHFYIVGNIAYKKDNRDIQIRKELLIIKEFCYVISFVRKNREHIIDPVGSRPDELSVKDGKKYRKLKNIAEKLVWLIMEIEPKENGNSDHEY